MPGDIIFSVGAVFLVLFTARLLLGRGNTTSRPNTPELQPAL
jgi:hypothetical protein